jgi:hypothetical protein
MIQNTIRCGLFALAVAAWPVAALAGDALSEALSGAGFTSVDTISVGGGGAKEGYMISTDFFEVHVDMSTMAAKEKKVKLGGASLGRFDFSKDTKAKFNVNFEDHRIMQAPGDYKNIRVSCYSIKQDSKRVKVMVLAERYTDTWQRIAAGCAIADIGAPVIEVRCIPTGADFKASATDLSWIELGVTLRLEAAAPPAGGRVATFNIPVRAREGDGPR